MKRSIVILAILALCLQAFSGTAAYAAATEADNIVDLSYSITGSTPVSAGGSIGITLIGTNRAGASLDNVYFTLDASSDFYRTPSSGSFLLRSSIPADLNGKEINDTPISLVYKGTGHILGFTLNYTINGKEYFESETLYIKEVEPASSGSGSVSQPPVTSQYLPKLGTVSINDIPYITAGTSAMITYSVKNSSIYQARNITATLKMNDEANPAKAPQVLDNLDLKQTVDQINGNETRDITFKIGILSSAPAGLYSLTLKYDFQNAYGDPPVSSTETVYIRVKNENTGPRLIVDNVAVRRGTSASNINLDIRVKNTGDFTAKDVKITLKGLKSGGFETYNCTDVKFIGKLDGASFQTVSYQLLMPESAASAGNELSVKMDYKDSTGTAYSDENQIFIPISTDEKSKPSLAFDRITSPQEILTINRDFDISLDLKNNGGSAAKNIKVSLAADKEIITKSLSPVYIDKLDSNAAKTVLFKLFVTDAAATRNYPIAISVDYEDQMGTKYSASQYVGVYVENGAVKTVPRLIVNKYTIDPPTVQAASDFRLIMSYLNTSSKTDVSNIKVTVSSDDGTFTPTDSGNSFYIDSIPKGKSVERELMLHVKPDAEQKSYTLTVNFDYEDDKGNPYTSKEIISVRVLQNPRLVTGELSLPPEAYVGQPLSIYVDFYNMGKSTLYNMMVKAEGNFQGQNLSYYVGNFESGRMDSFDTSITPTSPGALSGNIVFSFEDANGKVTEIKKEFTVNVMEMPQQGPMTDASGMPVDKVAAGMAGKTPGGISGLLIYAIPAVVVVIGIILFIVLRKRHIRRKEMSLDE